MYIKDYRQYNIGEICGTVLRHQRIQRRMAVGRPRLFYESLLFLRQRVESVDLSRTFILDIATCSCRSSVYITVRFTLSVNSLTRDFSISEPTHA